MSIAHNIKHRLSLREPLQESLDIVAQITDTLSLEKEVDLTEALAAVRALYPTCTHFERDFPSIAFSIATGVGKTRLMGAIIAYLYLAKGKKNFFILAPNLTIYDKLINDFGNPAYEKYVFKGISEFVHNRPVVITGDNYEQQGALFRESEIRINIFNIAKFNSDNKVQKKGGKVLAPRIKRLAEYLGQSYWEYLSQLTDLVMLMDEAHRYHADASKKAIDELKPILGIELTATPFDDKGNQFKNIVYEYSLAKALADGTFVKIPAIATRRNFEKGALSDREIDIIKLEDAISLHQDTKNELTIYARTYNVRQVKPFILVVCKDISHATEVFELINSDTFYAGKYKGKALQIDSSTKKEEEIEKLFVSLENTDNQIEIVIHVNMLKEGWDVTNLYTIVPLRAANATILIEQTIGRGLRLPYQGKRTGEAKIDTLTIVSHENFNAIVQAAQNPNSILNKMHFVQIAPEDISVSTTVVTSKNRIEKEAETEQEKVHLIENEIEKAKAQTHLDAKNAIIKVLPDFNTLTEVTKIEDLAKPEVKAQVIQQIEDSLSQGQQSIFNADILAEAKEIYESVVTQYKQNLIEIPRMELKEGKAKAEFKHFELNTSGFHFRALEEEIIRVELQGIRSDTLRATSSGSYGNPLTIIVMELTRFAEIDYDENAPLLYHLATQAFEAIKQNAASEEDALKAVFQFKSAIAQKIYVQMKANWELYVEHIVSNILPFVKIEEWNFSALVNEGYKSYQEIVTPTSSVPKYVFRGFAKACHFEYKFDSKTEQDLSFVLENDKEVLKWLRPAPNQFRILWDNNTKKYEPDFIVEIEKAIFMVEIKAQDRLNDTEVIQKMTAAKKYCEYATEFTIQNGGKPWYYLLIPHSAVSRISSMSYFIELYLK
jgi:type III restriction enzyme